MDTGPQRSSASENVISLRLANNPSPYWSKFYYNSILLVSAARARLHDLFMY